MYSFQPLTLSPGSPLSSPSKDKYGDRFIPARAGAAWHINFNLNPVSYPDAVLYTSLSVFPPSYNIAQPRYPELKQSYLNI